MEKEILLKEIENTNHLNELYPLWNEFKAYLENQPSLLELGQLFGFNYHLQEKFKKLRFSASDEQEIDRQLKDMVTFFQKYNLAN